MKNTSDLVLTTTSVIALVALVAMIVMQVLELGSY